MNDIELVKACAGAMGLETKMRHMPFVEHEILCFKKPAEIQHFVWMPYNPLANDEQAMALVKRFRLSISGESDSWWCMTLDGNFESPDSTDLNRAICLVVAQLHGGRNGQG